MSKLEKLRDTKSLSDLANLLGYKPKAVSYILYKIPSEKKYSAFTIPKKTGGERRIKAPIDPLKDLQRRLADLLNECFEEICATSKNQKCLSYGFRKGKDGSIIKNAINHRNKRHVFNVDLQDFFPSINFGRVRGFFIKNRHFELDPGVATVIAQIACHENELPQGSPCSPVISNLIGHLLDIRMVNLAKKAKCTYSRYADDLTFSTNKNEFPEIIAKPEKPECNIWLAGERLEKEINKVGFSINKNKTSMQYKARRQMVTGLVVNKKINVKREYYKNARSMCYSLFQSDQYYIEKHSTIPSAGTTILDDGAADKKGEPTKEYEKIIGNMAQLEGVLNFIYHVKDEHDKRDRYEKVKHRSAMVELYRKFLFYKYFFSVDRPLIVCEGKTDSVYLKCALMQLCDHYSDLIQKKKDTYEFNISFFKVSKKIMDVLDISEGTGGQLALMNIYEKYISMFKGCGKKHPVILLIDNDNGSKEIKNKLNVDDLSGPFCYYRQNLYVVAIPLGPDGKERMIEDLFEAKVLKAKVDGKVFNRKTKQLTATEYGKTVFAEKVVRANQKSINFDGFRGVLDSFRAAIEDYKKRM